MTEEEAIALCVEQGFCKSIETNNETNNESDNFFSKLFSKLFSPDKTDTDTWLIRIGCLVGLFVFIAFLLKGANALAQKLAS